MKQYEKNKVAGNAGGDKSSFNAESRFSAPSSMPQSKITTITTSDPYQTALSINNNNMYAPNNQ